MLYFFAAVGALTFCCTVALALLVVWQEVRERWGR